MKNRKKMLWISPYAPYDGVAHGGGKTHNFYIKYFQKTQKFDITLLSLCMPEEEDCLDLDRYGIKNYIYVMDKNKCSKLARVIVSGLAYRNPLDRYAGVCLPYERWHMNRQIIKYKKEQEIPDIIVLQWTFSLMFIDLLKKYFPNSMIVSIEEDVTFLNFQRKSSTCENANWRKNFWKLRYAIMREKELLGLTKVDLVVTNNSKDTRLLEDNGLTNSIFTAVPYFDSYDHVRRDITSKDIIFWGAMSRKENYFSAIWFIENVLPKIEDPEVRFLIVGANPDKLLRKYVSDRIVVTGYVQDVTDYFSKALCAVAPLVGGAGIKIKILEAMSAGIPILTNEIGIEGIAAVKNRDFLYCETPDEYAENINKILEGRLDVSTLSLRSKKFMKENYDLSRKLDELIDLISI